MWTNGVRFVIPISFWLVGLGQVETRREPESSTAPPAVPKVDRPEIAEISALKVDVHDRADGNSFVAGELSRGDRVKVHGVVAGGWLKVDPPPTTICWIERSAIEFGKRSAVGAEHVLHRVGSG